MPFHTVPHHSTLLWNGAGVPSVPQCSTSPEHCGTPPTFTDAELYRLRTCNPDRSDPWRRHSLTIEYFAQRPCHIRILGAHASPRLGEPRLHPCSPCATQHPKHHPPC